MRLELGTFPVNDVRFGHATRWSDGALTIDRDAVLGAVRDDALVAAASLEIARPGESVRIWPVRDVVEPRSRSAGPASPTPDVRPVHRDGRARAHSPAGRHRGDRGLVGQLARRRGRFRGRVHRHDGAVGRADPSVGHRQRLPGGRARSRAGRPDEKRGRTRATLAVSDALAAAVRDLAPPELEVFELSPAPASLPGVVYIQCVHSPQAMSLADHLLHRHLRHHPADAAMAAPSQRDPRRRPVRSLPHPLRDVVDGRQQPALPRPLPAPRPRLDFLGVIVFRTEWTTQTEKTSWPNRPRSSPRCSARKAPS